MLLDMLDQRDAVAVGQFHIGKAKVEGFFVQQAGRVAIVFRAARLQAHAQQRDFEQFTNIGLVVDD